MRQSTRTLEDRLAALAKADLAPKKRGDVIQPDIERLKARVIDSAGMDEKHLLRPLLLFRGGQSEGRIRSLFNLMVGLMDADVPSATEAVKASRHEDFRHLCGVHNNPANMTISSFASRLVLRKDVAELIPGLWEYARHIVNSTGGTMFFLAPIPAYILSKTYRDWRKMPAHLRPARRQYRRVAEFYPYISEEPNEDHALLLTVDGIVPKGLPNDIRCDLCQDMLVAVLSGATTVENLRADLPEHLKRFRKMFPEKYGPFSLDAPMPGTEDMRWDSALDARTSRPIYVSDNESEREEAD